MGGGGEASTDAEYEGGDTEESGLKLVSGGDEESMMGGTLKSNDRRKVRRHTKEFVLENEVQEGKGVSVGDWLPRVTVLMADNVILMWVAAR